MLFYCSLVRENAERYVCWGCLVFGIDGLKAFVVSFLLVYGTQNRFRLVVGRRAL